MAAVILCLLFRAFWCVNDCRNRFKYVGGQVCCPTSDVAGSTTVALSLINLWRTTTR